MGYRLVIFDFDGTLADSADWFISMSNEVARRFRFREISEEEVAMLRGRSRREVVAYMRVPAWKMPFIARHTRKLVSENTSKIPLFPESRALIRRLNEAGVVLALVSSNSEANVRRILGDDLADCISHYACGASMFGKTPKFRSVIRKADARHAQVLSIGDETREHQLAGDGTCPSNGHGAFLSGMHKDRARAEFCPSRGVFGGRVHKDRRLRAEAP